MTSEIEKQDFIDKIKSKIQRELLDIEERTDLSTEQKTSQVIHIFCATCAGVAIQPIPFADIFILTPLQAYMGSRIASIQGVPISESKATTIVTDLAKVIGLGLLAQQLAIGAYKTFIPFLGAVTTVPMVYGLTYGMGKVMEAYFESKAKGQKIDPNLLKDIWKKAKKEGEKEGKAKQSEIEEDNKANKGQE